MTRLPNSAARAKPGELTVAQVARLRQTSLLAARRWMSRNARKYMIRRGRFWFIRARDYASLTDPPMDPRVVQEINLLRDETRENTRRLNVHHNALAKLHLL